VSATHIEHIVGARLFDQRYDVCFVFARTKIRILLCCSEPSFTSEQPMSAALSRQKKNPANWVSSPGLI
jgi:hypothetical protein